MTKPELREAFAPVPARHEYLFPAALALAFCIVGSLPYIYGYQTALEGKAFMGFVGRGTAGLNGYFMFAKQVQEGSHLLENLSTPEPLPRTYVNLEWWVFGMIARLSGLSLILVFHLDRVFTAFLFCCSAYYLAARCLPTPGWRRLSVALLTLGSGLGWTLLLLTRAGGFDLPKSFDWPALDLQGVSLFAYLINQPHFVRAMACAALTYGFLIEGERSGRMRFFVYSGLAALAHSAIRPYHIAEFYLILTLFPVLLCVREGRFSLARFRGYALTGLVHLPAVLYFIWLAWDGALGMEGWKRQSRFLLSTVVWLGIPFLLVCIHFAISGLREMRNARPATILLGLWLGLAWLLVNAFPFFVAGHEAAFGAYTLGAVNLALIGPVPVLLRWTRAGSFGRAFAGLGNAALAAVLIVICMPSSVYAYTRMFTDLHDPVYPQHYYLDEDTLAALRWLQDHSKPEDVVLASHDVLQYVPRFSHNKTVTFHDMLTANYYDKTAQVRQFFANKGDDAFKQWLVRQYGVKYLVYGPEEREEGPMSPSDHPWLAPVFEHGQTVVYRVQF